MPEPKNGESKKSYLERCVPKLIDEGKSTDQAVAICSSMYAKASEELTACTEVCLEFKAYYEDGTFKEVMSEETLHPDMTLAEAFAKLGLKPGVKYEFELCAEEC